MGSTLNNEHTPKHTPLSDRQTAAMLTLDYLVLRGTGAMERRTIALPTFTLWRHCLSSVPKVL